MKEKNQQTANSHEVINKDAGLPSHFMSLLKKFQNLQKIEWQGMKPGLERIEQACGALGNPQQKLKLIHVAGTNGKGSVSAMLQQMLSTSGYRVGLFTSPHLVRVHERFRINETEINDIQLEQILKEIDQTLSPSPVLSFFELCTLIAFLHFSHEKVDVAIIETGLGGRLDSTNLITPCVSVITEIGLDHEEILGHGIEKITREKAGILKPHVPVVCGTKNEEAQKIIQEIAKERNCPLFQVSPPRLNDDHSFNVKQWKNLRTSLIGNHQAQNAAIAMEVLEVLLMGVKNIPSEVFLEKNIRQALLSVQWPGRMEWVQHHPDILFDGAHNPQGIEALVETLYQLNPLQKWKILFGATQGKEISKMLQELEKIGEEILLCPFENSRSLNWKDPFEMKLKIPTKIKGNAFETFQETVKGLKEGQSLLVTGSLYLVGEIKRMNIGKF